MNPSGSKGTQCIHQDFLRIVDTDTYYVRIPGLTGRILGSYLRDKPRHSSFVAIRQLENHMSQSCLTDVISKIF
jgi:hypothetical protein